MFKQCGIQINEFDSSSPSYAKWMRIKLKQARPVSIVGTTGNNDGDDRAWKWIKAQGEAFTWWGRWKVLGNSRAAYGYQIGYAPQERQFWIFSLPERSLDLVEWNHMTSGDDEVLNPVVLNQAWLDGRGVRPLAAGSSTLGTRGQGMGPTFDVESPGTAYKGSGQFFTAGPLTWSAFPIYGTDDS